MTLLAPVFAFLLTVHATTCALLVVDPDRIWLVAGAMAVCTAFGAWVEPRLSNFLDRPRRWRILAVVWFLYGANLMMLLVAAADQGVFQLAQWTQSLIYFQAGFLALAGAGRGYVGAIHNALAFVFVAALVGGALAAVAVTGYAGILALWLVLDHYERKQARAARAWRAAAPCVLATVGLLAAAFWAWPPEPYERIARQVRFAASPEQMEGLWKSVLELVGVCVLGVGAVFLIGKWLGLGRRDRAAAEEVERGAGKRRTVVPRAESEGPAVEMGGWRGRVVRLYVRFLRRAGRLGVRRRPDWTPREIALRLPEEAEPLTQVFVRARYGPADVTEADYRAAESAAGRALGALRR